MNHTFLVTYNFEQVFLFLGILLLRIFEILLDFRIYISFPFRLTDELSW